MMMKMILRLGGRRRAKVQETEIKRGSDRKKEGISISERSREVGRETNKEGANIRKQIDKQIDTEMKRVYRMTEGQIYSGDGIRLFLICGTA